MSSEELLQLTNKDLRIDEYPFSIRALSADDGGGYLIEYPDVPGCISDGETAEEAIHNGKDALRSVLLTKMEFGDPIPAPQSAVRRKDRVYLEQGVVESLMEVANRKGIELDALVNDLLRKELAIVEILR